MAWLVALVAFAVFLFILPHLLRKAKSPKRGAAGAITLALGLAFSSFLDPAAKTAIESIEKKKEAGKLEDENEREKGRR